MFGLGNAKQEPAGALRFVLNSKTKRAAQLNACQLDDCGRCRHGPFSLHALGSLRLCAESNWLLLTCRGQITEDAELGLPSLVVVAVHNTLAMSEQFDCTFQTDLSH